MEGQRGDAWMFHVLILWFGWGGGGYNVRRSVRPPAVTTVCRLVGLRLLRHGGALVSLSGASLSVLLEVMVENLRVRLLMRRQDVHEWSRWVGRGCGRVHGASAAQR